MEKNDKSTLVLELGSSQQCLCSSAVKKSRHSTLHHALQASRPGLRFRTAAGATWHPCLHARSAASASQLRTTIPSAMLFGGPGVADVAAPGDWVRRCACALSPFRSPLSLFRTGGGGTGGTGGGGGGGGSGGGGGGGSAGCRRWIKMPSTEQFAKQDDSLYLRPPALCCCNAAAASEAASTAGRIRSSTAKWPKTCRRRRESLSVWHT